MNLHEQLERPFTEQRTRYVILQHGLATRCERNTIYALKNSHAAYSPDLDNHLFGMQSKRFNSEEDIQERVDDFVTDEQPSFFEDGIYNLQMRKDYGEDEYFETSDLVT